MSLKKGRPDWTTGVQPRLPTPTPLNWGAVFNGDFESGTLDGWTVRAGTPSIVSDITAGSHSRFALSLPLGSRVRQFLLAKIPQNTGGPVRCVFRLRYAQAGGQINVNFINDDETLTTAIGVLVGPPGTFVIVALNAAQASNIQFLEFENVAPSLSDAHIDDVTLYGFQPFGTGLLDLTGALVDPTNLRQVSGSAITLGQKTMANSFPVVIASDQTAIPVTVTFPATQNVNIVQVSGAAITLGQKLMASSFPVVIASDQSAFPVNAVQSGTWTVRVQDSAGTSITLGQKLMASSWPIVIASDQSAISVNASQVGTWAVNVTQVGGAAITLGQKAMASSFPVVIASDQSAYPVNAVQSGVWTVRVQDSAGTSITLGQKLMAASWPVVIASDQSGIPVNASQVGTWAVNITQWGSAATTLGQKLMASSVPVVIASDQSALSVNATQVGTYAVNITQVSGVAITLGQKAMAASYPVVLASDQTAIPVNASQVGTWAVNLTQVSGVAITLGQKAMASSFPVVIASDQSNLGVVEAAGASVTRINLVYNAASVAPHGATQRFTYTVPANRMFILESAGAVITRDVAPTVSGDVEARIREFANDNRFVEARIRDATVGAKDHDRIGTKIIFMATERIDGDTFDGSTGGSMIYVMHLIGREVPRI